MDTKTLDETETTLYHRYFSQRKIAQKIYENFVLLQLKKFQNKYEKKSEFKNILHVNTAVGKGGAAKVAHNYLNLSLNRLGYNSTLLAGKLYTDNEPYTQELECKNLKLHKLLHKYQKTAGLLDFYNLSSFSIPDLEVFKNADVLHLHNLHGSYFSPFLLPKITSLKPTVWTLHDEQAFTGHCAYAFDCKKWQTGCGNCDDLAFYPKIKKDTTDFLINTKKKIYDMSSFTVVCPSNWLADRVKESILSEKDIRVIYNGIDEKVFVNTPKSQAREMLNLPQYKKILMFSASGSIKNPQKGGKYVFELYEKLKHRKDLLFLNIGGGKSNKIAKNWIDIDYVNDEKAMALYYSASDVFIYPSMAETFGLVVAESMACATPVVAFDNSALSEIILHKETGYLAVNKNIDDFINGVDFFLKSEEQRIRAGEKARKRVVESFTLDLMIKNYIELYKEILR